MTLPLINYGAAANDHTGDPLRTAFQTTDSAIQALNADEIILSAVAALVNDPTTGNANLSSIVNSVLIGNSALHNAIIVPYPRTDAEITAGVIPTNFTYPPGNVLRYGTNTTPGATDMSTAIQAALNSNVTVYVPGGQYLAGGLLMPSTAGLVLFGDGTSSVLIQKADGNPLIRWSQTSIVYTEGYIERLAFKGTAGTGHTINTAGVGGITLEDLYFTDVPVGFSSIFANGTAATYAHDQRMRNIQIYSNTAGHSGIRCGPLQADCDIDGFVMNGGFSTSYCLYLDSGAQTTTMANSHPYNAAINVVCGAGSNGGVYFDSCTLDNATQDVAVFTGSSNLMFTQVHFEAIKAGKNGLTLTNSTATSLINCEWDAAFGAGYAVTETGTTNQTFVRGGNIGTLANYGAGPFNFINALSYASGVAGWNPLGQAYYFSGCTTAPQAQNTTQFLGCNSGQASSNLTNYLVPQPSLLVSLTVNVSVTPAAGQTYVFTLKNGAGTVFGTITVNNGSFGGTVTINQSITQFDVIAIQSVYSVTSGASNSRWSIGLTA